MAQAAIRNCPNLKGLGIRVGGKNTDNASYMNLCTEIVKTKPGIETLDLSDIQLDTAHALVAFFTKVSTVKTLVLRNLRIAGGWVDCQVPFICKLATLRLWNADLTSPWLKGLLLQLMEQVPTMKELLLDHCVPEQPPHNVMTDILGAVLKANSVTSFWALKIRRFSLDKDVICDGLKGNTALRVLHLDSGHSLICPEMVETLKYYNKTLRGLHVELNPESQQIWKQIVYYLFLNYFGRGEAQKPDFAFSGLVEVLCRIAEDEAHVISHMTALLRQNLQLGFLSLNPSLWTGAAETSSCVQSG